MALDLETQRDIGRLSEAVRALQASVLTLQGQVDSVQTTLAEAKGGWRTLVWLGGAAGASGAAVGAFLHSLMGKLPGGTP